MRALSHYWRVTRQDNIVAQALLQKAIAIDPDYGRALACWRPAMSSVPAWDDGRYGNGRDDRRARGPGSNPGRQRGTVGALCAGQHILFTRRFDDSLAEFELALQLDPSFSPAQGYRGGAGLLRRSEKGDLAARRALRLSPRDPFAAIYCGVAAYARFVGRNSVRPFACRAKPWTTQRFGRSAPGSHGGGGDDPDQPLAKAALQELRRAQPNISLTWVANQIPFKRDATESTIWMVSREPAWTSCRAAKMSPLVIPGTSAFRTMLSNFPPPKPCSIRR